MKKILAIAATCGALFASCGGVDRAGTRDQIVKSIEDAGGKADADCVDGVFDKYSDAELEAIDKEVGANATEVSDSATQLFAQLQECFSFAS